MKSISLASALKNVFQSIGNNRKEKKNQDPDVVGIFKQWNEFGQFKGYWIDVTYADKTNPLLLSFDITPYYTRIIGDLQRVPIFTPGKHNYPQTLNPKALKPITIKKRGSTKLRSKKLRTVKA